MAINEQAIIEAFQRVKEDMDLLKDEIEVLKGQLIREKLERERLQIGLATDLIQEIEENKKQLTKKNNYTPSREEKVVKINKKIKPNVEIIPEEDNLTDFRIEENLDEDTEELY